MSIHRHEPTPPRRPEGRRVRASDVIEIAGDVESSVVSAIVATGATTGELREAVAWLEADDAMGDRQEPSNAIVERLAQILDEQRMPADYPEP